MTVLRGARGCLGPAEQQPTTAISEEESSFKGGGGVSSAAFGRTERPRRSGQRRRAEATAPEGEDALLNESTIGTGGSSRRGGGGWHSRHQHTARSRALDGGDDDQGGLGLGRAKDAAGGERLLTGRRSRRLDCRCRCPRSLYTSRERHHRGGFVTTMTRLRLWPPGQQLQRRRPHGQRRWRQPTRRMGVALAPPAARGRRPSPPRGTAPFSPARGGPSRGGGPPPGTPTPTGVVELRLESSRDRPRAPPLEAV